MAVPKALRKTVEQGKRIEEAIIAEQEAAAKGELEIAPAKPYAMPEAQRGLGDPGLTIPKPEDFQKEKPPAKDKETEGEGSEGNRPDLENSESKDVPPETQVTDASVTPEAPAPVEPPQPVDWEQKFRSMQGRFNKQVPELQGALRDSQEQIALLHAKLDSLEKAAVQPSASAPEPPVAAQEILPSAAVGISPEEKTEWGADFIDIVHRAAVEAVQPLLGSLESKLNDRFTNVTTDVGKMAEQVALSDQDRLLQQLAMQVPDYQAINKNPDFLVWLQTPLPYDLQNRTRQHALREAYSEKRADLVIRIFQDFMKEQETVSPSPPPPAPTPQAQPSRMVVSDTPKVDLDTLIAPGIGRAEPDNTPTPDATLYSRRGLAQLSQAYARGEFRGKEDEYNRLMGSYQKAIAEGRLVE